MVGAPPSSPSSGPQLALLLLRGFRTLVDAARRELAERGHPDIRDGHEFAMRAIEAGADSAKALAVRLRVTKQAAAKIITSLEARGYVTRESDPADGRRRPLQLTERGRDMLRQGQAIFDRLRDGWAEQVGSADLERMESVLRRLVGESDARTEGTAWFARND